MSDVRRLAEKLNTLGSIYGNLTKIACDAGTVARADMNMQLLQTYARSLRDLHAEAGELVTHAVRVLGLGTNAEERKTLMAIFAREEVRSDGKGNQEGIEEGQQGKEEVLNVDGTPTT